MPILGFLRRSGRQVHRTHSLWGLARTASRTTAWPPASGSKSTFGTTVRAIQVATTSVAPYELLKEVHGIHSVI